MVTIMHFLFVLMHKMEEFISQHILSQTQLLLLIFVCYLENISFGMRLKNIFTQELDRIITIEFEGFDEVDDILEKTLVIELMGKHGNIILKDDNNIILDCLRHIPNPENAEQSRLPNTVYHYPNTTKKSLLEINDLETFKKYLPLEVSTTTKDLPNLISNTYNGISQATVQAYLNYFSLESVPLSEALEKIYSYLHNLFCINFLYKSPSFCF